MIVYLVIAIIKQKYHKSMSQLLHFLEVNLFERKPLISVFKFNERKIEKRDDYEDNQLKLFEY